MLDCYIVYPNTAGYGEVHFNIKPEEIRGEGLIKIKDILRGFFTIIETLPLLPRFIKLKYAPTTPLLSP